MADYHLYFLKGDLLVGCGGIEAGNDIEAARIAEDKGRGDIVEVWNAHSHVRIVSTGGARLETPWDDEPGGAAALSVLRATPVRAIKRGLLGARHALW